LTAVPQNEQLISLKSKTPNGDLIDSSYPDFRDLRDRLHPVAHLAAYRNRPVYLGQDTNQERLWAQFVSPNYFDVLQLQPRLGRTLSAGEQSDATGAAPVVLLSERLWQTRFQSDPNILGRTLYLNRQPLTVIGVLPTAFRGTTIGLAFDLWIPATMYPALAMETGLLERRSSRPFALFGRLNPGATVASANAAANTITQSLGQAFPATNRSVSAQAMRLVDSPDEASSMLGRPLKLLLAVAILLLCIVCVNVGNLLLARSVSREREFSIRLGLGANTVNLVRLLMLESTALSLLGAAGGCVFAVFSVGLLSLFIPATDMPAGLEPVLGLNTWLVTALLCFATALLSGLAPAFHFLRGTVQSGLQSISRGATAGRSALRLRSFLVASEITLATVTLACAGLFLHSFWNARNANPGFQPQGVLLLGLDTNSTRATSDENLQRFLRLQENLARLPGIEDVAIGEHVPLGFDKGSWEETAFDGYTPRPGENMKFYHNRVSPNYFQTMRIPLLAGRDFNAADDKTKPLVAIVNETLVRRFFPDGIAVGKQLKIWGGKRVLTIVGVARDIKVHRLDEAPIPYFYHPLAQANLAGVGMGLHIRARGDLNTLSESVQRSIRQLTPELGITARTTLTDFIGAAYFAQKISAGVLGFLGAISLLLAGIGLYGVMAFAVAQRTREFGVRIAVGAAPLDLLRMAMKEGLQVAILSIILGIALSIAAGVAAASLLYGVPSVDLPVLAAAAFFLLLIATLATWLPARRAATIDPIQALRMD
jgi:predicted permease